LLTDEEQQAEGLYDVVTPEYNEKTQELGDIYWDTDNGNFTYPVTDITFDDSLEQMKISAILLLKSNLNLKLFETDWYYTRKIDINVPVPETVQTKRDELRGSFSVKENEIIALTEKAEVANFDTSI
jgi:putative lipase involved disintegration of autophagic bodies